MKNTHGKQSRIIILILVCLLVIVIAIVMILRPGEEGVFNGKRALADVRSQVEMGPRTPGSEAHQRAGTWIMAELQKAGWQVEEQVGVFSGQSIRNIVAKKGDGAPWYILGAHYDTRLVADRDEDALMQELPVPGANDGASGVAVLLELARSLPEDLQGQVWLVFFDAEDQGKLPGWEWILGSSYFAGKLTGKPDGVVVVDMIGDADLTIYMEGNSDKALATEIWQTADQAGYARLFPTQIEYEILDDHKPFVERGIPAVLLIDMDYAWWHTTGDTPDKVSASSLDAVGTTLYDWLVAILGK